MPVIPIQLKPTFPLDEAKISRLKREAIWRSPGLLARRTVANFMHFLAPTADFSKDVMAGWKDRDEELTARVVHQMIAESNDGQDEEIRKLVRNLNGVGKWQYAVSLGKFLLLKQHIETSLHQGSKLTDRKKEIEKLVDSLCQEVCQEIFEIATESDQLAEVLTSGDQSRLDTFSERVSTGHSRMMHAYATLSGTAERLVVLMEPGTERPDATERKKSELDRLIEVLREENEVSQAVDQRIRNELPRI